MDTNNQRTDKFRIVPHTPYVYRIERLYIEELMMEVERKSIFKSSLTIFKDKQEVWKKYGVDVNPYIDVTLTPTFSNSDGGVRWVRETLTYKTIDEARQKIDEILEEEKKRDEFMNQEVVYYGE